MNAERRIIFEKGISCLPQIVLTQKKGENGEELATDEAAIWKRVINYRLSKLLCPKTIYETHPGYGISSKIYLYTSPITTIFNQVTIKDYEDKIDLIDIDPFGQPWDFLNESMRFIDTKKTVLAISNGEALAVRRNLKRAQKYPTKYFGRRLPLWVTKEYLPKLEQMTKMKVKFFYAFPTTIRAIISNKNLPQSLWQDCPQWMWWLQKYSGQL